MFFFLLSLFSDYQTMLEMERFLKDEPKPLLIKRPKNGSFSSSSSSSSSKCSGNFFSSSSSSSSSFSTTSCSSPSPPILLNTNPIFWDTMPNTILSTDTFNQAKQSQNKVNIKNNFKIKPISCSLATSDAESNKSLDVDDEKSSASSFGSSSLSSSPTPTPTATMQPVNGYHSGHLLSAQHFNGVASQVKELFSLPNSASTVNSSNNANSSTNNPFHFNSSTYIASSANGDWPMAEDQKSIPQQQQQQPQQITFAKVFNGSNDNNNNTICTKSNGGESVFYFKPQSTGNELPIANGQVSTKLPPHNVVSATTLQQSNCAFPNSHQVLYTTSNNINDSKSEILHQTNIIAKVTNSASAAINGTTTRIIQTPTATVRVVGINPSTKTQLQQSVLNGQIRSHNLDELLGTSIRINGTLPIGNGCVKNSLTPPTSPEQQQQRLGIQKISNAGTAISTTDLMGHPKLVTIHSSNVLSNMTMNGNIHSLSPHSRTVAVTGATTAATANVLVPITSNLVSNQNQSTLVNGNSSSNISSISSKNTNGQTGSTPTAVAVVSNNHSQSNPPVQTISLQLSSTNHETGALLIKQQPNSAAVNHHPALHNHHHSSQQQATAHHVLSTIQNKNISPTRSNSKNNVALSSGTVSMATTVAATLTTTTINNCLKNGPLITSNISNVANHSLPTFTSSVSSSSTLCSSTPATTSASLSPGSLVNGDSSTNGIIIASEAKLTTIANNSNNNNTSNNNNSSASRNSVNNNVNNVNGIMSPTSNGTSTISSISISPDGKRRIHKCLFTGCKKVYTKSSHLKAHQRTHTGK